MDCKFISYTYLSSISRPMSVFLCKTRFYCSTRSLLTASSLGRLRNPNMCSLSRRWFSSSDSDQKQFFTVSYLVDSLALSPKQALSVSKRVAFKTSEKPDKVIRVFEDYGFTKAQISALIRARPSILMANSEKIILPKLEFLKAKGFSLPKMAKKLPVFPTILNCSLDKQIIPAYEYLMNVFYSEKKLILIVERYPDILVLNVEKHLVPIIAVLRKLGVPDSNIVTFISKTPKGVTANSDKFNEIVAQVVEMGFSATRITFVIAMAVFLSTSKLKRESKVMAYKKWGWSDEDVSKTFLRYPQCMMISVDKITAMMNFFVNEMGLNPRHLVKYPMVLNLSLEKRIKPRHFVVRALLSKGLVKEAVNLGGMYGSAEKKFVQKFVMPYEEKAPELMKLYKDKLDLSSVKSLS